MLGYHLLAVLCAWFSVCSLKLLKICQIGLKSLKNCLLSAKLVCTFARHLLVSREIISVSRENILSRAKPFLSRAKPFLSRAKSFLFRAKLNPGVKFRASLKHLRVAWNLSRATYNFFARPGKVLARNLVSAIHLLVCFCCLRPERCLFLSSLLFLVREQSYTMTFCFTESMTLAL